MAFNITPTSGDGPYILSAVVNDSHLIDGINYVATVRTSTAVGSCPARGTASSLSSVIVDSLLTDGSVDSGTQNVPVGSCRTYTLEIVRQSDAQIIASVNAEVDNV